MGVAPSGKEGNAVIKCAGQGARAVSAEGWRRLCSPRKGEKLLHSVLKNLLATLGKINTRAKYLKTPIFFFLLSSKEKVREAKIQI